MMKFDSMTPDTEVTRQAHGWISDWLAWLLSNAAPATVTGLVTLALVCAVIGYFLSALGWRIWIARKWRRRQHCRADRRSAVSGKSVSVRVDLGGSRIIKKKNTAITEYRVIK